MDASNPATIRWSKTAVEAGPQPGGRFFHAAFRNLRQGLSLSTPSTEIMNVPYISNGQPDQKDGTRFELVVFGGQQYGRTLGYLDAWYAELFQTPEGCVASVDDDGSDRLIWRLRWRRQLSSWIEPPLSGEVLSGDFPVSRKGHTTLVVGRKLIVFGGADVTEDGKSSSLADSNVWIYDSSPCVTNDQSSLNCRWKVPHITGDPPIPRKGHSSRLVGGELLISGGFNEAGDRLSDRICHRLSFC